MRKILQIIIGVAAYIISWQGLVLAFHMPKYIFPAPVDVAMAYIRFPELFLENLWITALEAIIGFLVANVISISIAIVIFRIRRAESVIMPIAVTLETIPIIAITPLLVLWFGSGLTSRIATAGLICFFPALVNLLRGMKSINGNLLDLFKIYNSSWLSTLKLLVLPASLPYLFSSLKISSSLAVVGALVGEFIGANKGLGFLIIVNYYNSNTAVVFGAIILSSLLGIFLYYLLQGFENKKITWADSVD